MNPKKGATMEPIDKPQAPAWVAEAALQDLLGTSSSEGEGAV